MRSMAKLVTIIITYYQRRNIFLLHDRGFDLRSCFSTIHIFCFKFLSAKAAYRLMEIIIQSLHLTNNAFSLRVNYVIRVSTASKKRISTFTKLKPLLGARPMFRKLIRRHSCLVK
jgi:hypothetical protein